MPGICIAVVQLQVAGFGACVQPLCEVARALVNLFMYVKAAVGVYRSAGQDFRPDMPSAEYLDGLIWCCTS